MLRHEGFGLIGLTAFYGQRHDAELEASRRAAKMLAVEEHLICEITGGVFSGSALLGSLPVPKNTDPRDIGQSIPVTYVPARNTVLLSMALAAAESRDCRNIAIGANVLDYSGYPDCRPEFLDAFEKVANLGTRAVESGEPFRILAPLLKMSKAEIISEGMRLGLDYSITSSCYDPSPNGRPCLACEACILRNIAFRELGQEDPLNFKHGIQFASHR
jgi:7-cyano-7-deazaguanine synthase